jgi:hypothetical protein
MVPRAAVVHPQGLRHFLECQVELLPDFSGDGFGWLVTEMGGVLGTGV